MSDEPPKGKYVRGGPPRVVRSALSGTWYVVSAYHDYGDGALIASQKREVHPDDAEGLERMWKATHRGDHDEDET